MGNGELVTHKYAAAEDLTHKYYSTGKITDCGRSNSSHELKHT